MVKSFSRGHKIFYDSKANIWLYKDSKQPVNENDRVACKRCGKPPTIEEYDACTGYIPGAKHACCGHGVETPTIIY